ncbi:hypothetical protein PCC6912_39010 [Chlorogloeopsis fritschii PCC 6912]|uniref:Uncharacterized protein n=1 Tax=Chlorogloeopsis fritschii PCC 6912 TaxID=211165 RepID=A0A433N7C4_CHLFR|nr:hypothetical protein [Chlorogloeopsis fritschii C42_A2020_084]RUR77510.1 hypothetical protein PCC6912_39010 [Chlorogloeopsis fritschii PCC 6912]
MKEKGEISFFLFPINSKPDAYLLILALASLTAAKKNNPVSGMLNAKIIAVVWLPKSGCPEVSSKTEPTAAIAAMHEQARNKPLFGVIVFTSTPPYAIGLTV